MDLGVACAVIVRLQVNAELQWYCTQSSLTLMNGLSIPNADEWIEYT